MDIIRPSPEQDNSPVIEAYVGRPGAPDSLELPVEPTSDGWRIARATLEDVLQRTAGDIYVIIAEGIADNPSESSAISLWGGSVTIDIERQDVRVRGKRNDLLGFQFGILAYLAQHVNAVQTAEQIHDAVWGPNEQSIPIKQKHGRVARALMALRRRFDKFEPGLGDSEEGVIQTIWEWNIDPQRNPTTLKKYLGYVAASTREKWEPPHVR